MKKSLISSLPASFFLIFLAMILMSCGGGGDGGGAGVPTSTFNGSVSGTLILAVDENGAIVAQDDTSGKAPDADGHFPFSLTVPGGHQYTIYFIVDEGTPTERIVPLFSGTTNIFSVTAGGTIDLGYVNTTLAEATAENDPLATAGITSEGATGPDTITLQNSTPILILIDRSDVGRMYRTQVQVKNPDGSVLTDGALVKDVVVYGPNGQELPQSGNSYYWDGLSFYFDSGSGPVSMPNSDIEVYLAASPGTLPAGFYTELITDSNGNLHMVKMYFEQPTEVGKPTNLAQFVNTDNSITLSWTNPAGITPPEYFLRLEIIHSDENLDGMGDIALMFHCNTSTNSYTIPASFVSSNLADKQQLQWRVQVRQQTGLIDFPNGTSQMALIYRNYSEKLALSVGPSTSIPFTSEMLAGKTFSAPPSSQYPDDVTVFQFFAGGTANYYHRQPDGQGGDVFETFSWNWSIDGDGRLILAAGGQTATATLLADTATSIDLLLDNGTTQENKHLIKTIPFVAAELPGTYSLVGGGSITFVSGGTGSITDEGTEIFTWSVDTEGVLILTFPAGGISNIYLLAGSTATNINFAGIGFENGLPVDVFNATLTRQ